MATSGIMTARQLATLLGDWRGSAPAYRALADRIRLLVIDGRILPGTRLPSERELADRLDSSRTTIVAAYGRLREEGYLRSRRGSGSVVQLPPPRATAPGEAPELVNFSMATPPAVPGLPDYVARAVERLPAELWRSGVDYVGLPVLREAIARRYTERGLPTQPDQIVVTNGAQHAIGVIARALLAPGDRVLTETPTYPHAVEALRATGARMVGTVVTGDGWDQDQLVDTLERVRPSLAYLIPDFHNPTGQSMPVDLRRRLIAAAARAGTVIIADETTAELDIDRGWAAGSLAGYATTQDEREAVILLGSTGKTVWGGLRLGWMRAEARHLSRIIASRPSMDLGVPVLEQLIATEAIADMSVVLRHRTGHLRGGRDLLGRLLAERLPEWRVPPADGGLSFWVHLGAPVSSALALASRAQGLRISAGPVFSSDGSLERYIRVPFTAAPSELEAGVEALAAAWGSLGSFAGSRGSELTEVA
ncbi:MAG: PLP-dependent aminotransferase family protein [Microbacterium sp.]|uniref:MocR-like transcription factor YczR n=1 Tax=Microbacterium sp. TaxID=51671 RepID=UPI0039E2D0FB